VAVAAVFFDVGETIINEARLRTAWAEYLGVSGAAFRSALEETIAAGQHHRQVFERFRPGFDLDAARRERAASGDVDLFGVGDLFPDVVPCLRALHARGCRIGLAGNQPAEAEQALRNLTLGVDFVATSTVLGVEKPSPDYFTRLAAMAGLPPHQVAHVGDRVDNDVIPARAAGLVAVFLERGPWAAVHARWPEADQAHLRLTSLAELPDALATLKRIGSGRRRRPV
jgi:FMN phosphatase YigB (HAD superfamily)